MGWPESEFGRASVKRSILELSDPQQFMRIHFPSFAGKSTWMEKAFWTIKNNPEFDWSNHRSYVEMPHTTALSDILEDVKILRQKHPQDHGPRGTRIYVNYKTHSSQVGEPKMTDPAGWRDDGWYMAWGKPTDKLIEVWGECVSDNIYASEFGAGSIEIIPWPVKEGYPRKYLIVGNVSRYTGSVWLALVTDINIPIYEEEKTSTNTL